MDIMRVTARWSGFQGAPGYSNFHFAAGGGLITDAQQVAERVRASFQQLQGILPTGVTVQVQREVEVLASETGVLDSFRTVTDPGVVTGAGGTTYSAASGAVVNWRTNDVRFGRRIRGRTFIVPLAGAIYDNTGSLNSIALTALGNFATTMRAGDADSEFGVWSRPVNGAGGVFASVVSHTVPDMAAVLRSRRD